MDNSKIIRTFVRLPKNKMLLSYYQEQWIEAGCDEAGRGCLAGPVFAAAVIFPPGYHHKRLNDSKKLSEKQRMELRPIIEQEALAYAVASVSAEEIDRINIHNASYLAMHKALDMLHIKAEYIIVDGNRFIPYQKVPYTCVVKGDGKYLSIAAASILAKTYRDEYMDTIAADFPDYDWMNNKGYPTVKHRSAVLAYGTTPHHRKSFRITDPQLKLF
ncbi:Ribonuclease HII [Sphingobacterium thalpophilum]|uniref:Ribonuclease HII n=2 Tax=Sphingobacterium thalpophilum TaxID=259 RepID=A0A4U9UVN2_9SPHI|nr:Ribonuclease HII [Sphingobacterium thalpophilum]